MHAGYAYPYTPWTSANLLPLVANSQQIATEAMTLSASDEMMRAGKSCGAKLDVYNASNVYPQGLAFNTCSPASPASHAGKSTDPQDKSLATSAFPIAQAQSSSEGGLTGACSSKIILIERFPAGWDEQRLKDIFSNFGSVTGCYMRCHPDQGYMEALVSMDSPASASQALNALKSYAVQVYDGGPYCLPLQMRFFSQMEQNDSFSMGSPATREHGQGRPFFQDRELPGVQQGFLNGSIGRPSATLTGELPTRPSTQTLPPSDNLLNFQPEGAHPGTPTNSTILEGPGSEDAGTPHSSSQRVSMGAPACQSRSKSVYVSNLPREADALWIYERFAPYGGILSVKVLNEKGSNRCRGVCFVNYMDPEGALSAVQSLDSVRLSGRLLQVSLQDPRHR